MPVAHRASVASGSTNPTTSFTITVPATVQDGDLLLVPVTSRGHVDTTAFCTCTDDDTTGNLWHLWRSDATRKCNLFVKRATAETAGKTVTVAGCVNSSAGGLSAFSGVDVSDIVGPPTSWVDDFDGYENNNAGDETHSAFVVATVDDGEVVFIVHNHTDDGAVTSQASEVFGPLTERFEKRSTGGSDCGVNLSSLPGMVTGLGTGNLTWVQSDLATKTLAIILKPSAGETYPKSGDDGAEAEDAATAPLTRLGVGTDGAEGTDSATAPRTRPAPGTDGAEATDAGTAALTVAKAGTDGAKATDAALATAVRPASGDDGAKAQDSATVEVIAAGVYDKSGSDGVETSDSAIAVLIRSAAGTDSALAEDAVTVSRILPLIASDALVTSDGATYTMGVLVIPHLRMVVTSGHKYRMPPTSESLYRMRPASRHLYTMEPV